MINLELFFAISLLIQLAHSCEELLTGFHRKWFFIKMSFLTFLLLDTVCSLFFVLVFIFPNFPYRIFLQYFFLLLMFANGVEHIVWWGSIKKYVPGLVTAFLHIFLFCIFYFQLLSN
ncbi:MAG: HXXEE domain-containing protein [Candidatus Paceibacterota bacterium]|jgi:hypothetical protein